MNTIRASVAAWLLAAYGAAFAAAPVVTDALLAPLESAYLRAVQPGEDAALHRELFETVLERIHRNYAQEVDLSRLTAAALKTFESLEPQSGEPAAVFTKAINAALATLDPYSRYLDSHAASNHRSTMTGSFGGVGLQVEMVDGLVRVVASMPGTPAAQAGLQSGDVIIGFDEQPVQGMTLAQAVSVMRGEPGTSIALMIRRSALRLTTALYRGPSGRSVQRTGVGPDIELLPAQAAASASRRREADTAHALPGTEEPPPPKARVEESRCAPVRTATDPALACALAFIEAGGLDAFLVAIEPREWPYSH